MVLAGVVSCVSSILAGVAHHWSQSGGLGAPEKVSTCKVVDTCMCLLVELLRSSTSRLAAIQVVKSGALVAMVDCHRVYPWKESVPPPPRTGPHFFILLTILEMHRLCIFRDVAIAVARTRSILSHPNKELRASYSPTLDPSQRSIHGLYGISVTRLLASELFHIWRGTRNVLSCRAKTVRQHLVASLSSCACSLQSSSATYNTVRASTHALAACALYTAQEHVKRRTGIRIDRTVAKL